MATITYIGDPRGGVSPSVCEMRGVAFEINVPIEIEDAAIIAKCEGNDHFTVEGGKVSRQTVEDDIAAVLEAEKQAQPAQEQPPRRRRGRPRKNPNPHPVDDDGPDEE